MSPDAERAARGVLLEVEELADGRFLVTGGAAPHTVSLEPFLDCDCADRAVRQTVCKHLRAVLGRRGDPETWELLAEVVREVLPTRAGRIRR